MIGPQTRSAARSGDLLSASVTPAAWPEAVAGALAEGWRFSGLHAIGAAQAPGVRMVLGRGGDHLLLTCRSGDRRIATVVDQLPAAVWDEREAHDLHGWAFDGHHPMRPLADHDVPTARWTPDVTGRDAYQVAVGPIHAGVIESGHFRFHVVGERILHLDLRLFYKHRGLEAAAEGLDYMSAIAYAQRACAADAVTNTVAYAHACEAALGLWPQTDVRRARTLLLELERLYNHLNDIAAICAGVGFAAGNMVFAALKERAQRLNQRLTSHRFLFDTVAVGRSDLHVDQAEADGARHQLAQLSDEFRRGWRELQFAGSLQERLDGVGTVGADDVRRLGGVGPVARAAGLAVDARCHAPRLWYEGFTAATVDTPTGDVAARLQIRGGELAATFAMLDALLADSIAPASAEPVGESGVLGAATVESPRGQTLCAVDLDDGTVARLHLRTGSYANWPLLALAVRDQLLPDFPLINKSFELCYACVDR
jgi:Ni,Fe-hydrogenase III large subunit